MIIKLRFKASRISVLFYTAVADPLDWYKCIYSFDIDYLFPIYISKTGLFNKINQRNQFVGSGSVSFHFHHLPIRSLDTES